ncbi:indole-3-glycerol phosphate synthase TrpC [Brevibacillus ginsengisoli]|uniref:indole-3-glycerol phosphate synthase TrpC n=1 Tax=Brevibacillus ginsengisoli TaxID=363854 RepID=UPI003CF56A78
MLPKIVKTKKQEIQQLKAGATRQQLQHLVDHAPSPKAFRAALIESTRPVSVIAEVKKASPSKGLIRTDVDPVRIAQAYEQVQVEAISVLTDRTFFQGDIDYLRQIREAINIPLLRKDFIIDEVQILESRGAGADCILLIAAILSGSEIEHFSRTAKELGMDVLVEVHNQAELELVCKHTTPDLLGINNRNLRTFETNIQTTAELIKQIPLGVPVVSESGISTRKDIEFVHSHGARAVLVGEHFMRQSSIESAVVSLVGERVMRS